MLPHQTQTLVDAKQRLRSLGAIEGRAYRVEGDGLVEIGISEEERNKVRSTLAPVDGVEGQREGRLSECLPCRAR